MRNTSNERSMSFAATEHQQYHIFMGNWQILQRLRFRCGQDGNVSTASEGFLRATAYSSSSITAPSPVISCFRFKHNHKHWSTVSRFKVEGQYLTSSVMPLKDAMITGETGRKNYDRVIVSSFRIYWELSTSLGKFKYVFVKAFLLFQLGGVFELADTEFEMPHVTCSQLDIDLNGLKEIFC